MMVSAAATVPVPADSPEARRYNRIRRWLGVADFFLGLALMAALLLTGWNGALRDLAYGATFQHYSLALFLYVLALMVLGKVLGFGLDYYSFRLEHRYQLSNMRLRAWLWDEGKGFLVGVVLAGIVAELLYFIMREAPQHWWLIAWAAFLGLFVLLAQLAPVVLFPIFYKFAPLENDELKERLVKLGERAGTRVRRRMLLSQDWAIRAASFSPTPYSRTIPRMKLKPS
jgi:STE24 endopeptidase